MEKYIARTKEQMMADLIAENLRLKRIIRCLVGEDTMWLHDCPVEGKMAVGKGEECNWCGAREKKP